MKDDSIQTQKILEAVLFLAEDPTPVSDLVQLLEIPAALIEAELAAMSERYEAEQRGIVLRNVAGGWRLATSPDVAGYLERFVHEQRAPKLSQAALETLAIIAYRQPIARSQIAEIRGVNSDRAVKTLLMRGVIEESGDEDGSGRATLFNTTEAFLERLGLEGLGQLPPLADHMPSPEKVDRMESGLGPGL